MKNTNQTKESKLVIRIDSELLEEFKKTCKKHDITMAQLLRLQIKKFIHHDQNRE